MSEKVASLGRKLLNWSLPAVFFLIPLVAIPFTTDALEPNKQVVMLLGVGLATLGWLAVAVAEKRLQWHGDWWLNAAPMLFLAALLLSTLFSLAGPESWWGYDGQEYASLATAVFGVMLFFVLVHGASEQLIKNSVLALLSSSALVAVVAIWFNLVGDANALVTWLTPVALIGLGFCLVADKHERKLTPVFGLLTGVVTLEVLIFLIQIDYWTVWAPLIVGLIVLLAATGFNSTHFPDKRRLLVPAVLLIVAVVFLGIKTQLKSPLGYVVAPSMDASWEITSQVLGQNPAQLFLGSGPGSFGLDYARYRPAETNQTIFWNTRFDRAQSQFLTLLATTGLFGVAAWLLLMGMIGAMGVKGLYESPSGPPQGWGGRAALLAGWSALLTTQFLSASNLALTFLFWGLSGLLVASAVMQSRKIRDFNQAPRVALLATGGLALLVICLALMLWSLGSKYAAELAFAKAVRLNATEPEPEELVVQMQRVVSWDKTNAVYQRNLATAYLALAQRIAAEGIADGDFGAADQERLAAPKDGALQAIQRAMTLGDYDGLNWATGGLIYLEFMSFIPDGQNYAASMLTRALELEPSNPAYQTDLGRVYLAVADRAQAIQDRPEVEDDLKATAVTNEAEDLRLAALNFEAAIRLKPDYAPAHYYLAATYERQGRLEEAAERLRTLALAAPDDAGLGFQLGVIYLKLDQQTAAEQELLRVLQIYPDYGNALWYLAAIKADQGDLQAALEILRRVDELSPGNENVAESIANLEAGLAPPPVPEPIETETLLIPVPVPLTAP